MLVDDIRSFAEGIPAPLTEKRGIYSVEFVVAERRAFLAKRKLTYSAQFRVDDAAREVRFTEMLKESGSGAYNGLDDSGPGFGFKKETCKTQAGPRQGSIQEQSVFFGAQYSYAFDFSKVRTFLEAKARDAGYAFTYQTTSHGL